MGTQHADEVSNNAANGGKFGEIHSGAAQAPASRA